MADMIIKPSSGNSLVFQDEGGDPALTVGTTGNTTLAGTANNLGTVTAGTLGSAVELPTGATIQTVANKNNSPYYSNSVSATTWLVSTSSFITTKGASSGFIFNWSGDIAPGAAGTTADQNNLVFFANLTDGTTRYNFGWYQPTVWNNGSSAVGAAEGDHDFYFLRETDGSTTGAAWRSHNMTYNSYNGNFSSYAKGTALQLKVGLRASGAYIGRHHGSSTAGLMGFTYGISEIKG